MSDLETSAISVLTAGQLSQAQLQIFSSHFSDLEEIRFADSNSPREKNTLLVKARHDWVLLLQSGESIESDLAGEIAATVAAQTDAWAFRLPCQDYYAGQRLPLERDRGEIRLIHRRHCRFDERNPDGELRVEGPVIRLRQPIRVEKYASSAEHLAFLQRSAVPHSLARRVLLFALRVLRMGIHLRNVTTLRYLWIDAGFDRGGSKEGTRSITDDASKND